MLADKHNGALEKRTAQLAAVEQQLPLQKFLLARNSHTSLSTKFAILATDARKNSGGVFWVCVGQIFENQIDLLPAPDLNRNPISLIKVRDTFFEE
ncbi:MAG: hypothetical protein ABSF34_11005 [Verrucomicrobiota bacterium]